MPRFLTGLIVVGHETSLPTFPYRTAHWKLDLVNTAASRCCRVNVTTFIDGKAFTNEDAREVYIEARDRAAADRVAFLLRAADDVLAGYCDPLFGGEVELVELTDAVDTDVPRRTKTTMGIPTVCELAARASSRARFTYALSKLWLSLKTCSTAPMDLDPASSWRKSRHPGEQVCFVNAIALAYAVLEELGLEVRASRQNPSTINGAWNPVVKADLEGRLRDAGCDCTETFLMLVRGSKTVLERERPQRSPSRAPWAWYSVRDCEVNLLDAIAHISWMRSHVAAHRLKPEFARALSVYDVANAQGLAERLLLDCLRIWPRERSHADSAQAG